MYSDVPPTGIDQGVILDDVYFHAIDEHHAGYVLTPRCDIVQGKVELIHICAIFDAWEIVKEFVQGDWLKLNLITPEGELIEGPLSQSKRKEFGNSLRNVVTNRVPRFHWLMPIQGSPNPQILDFQVLAALPIDEVQEKSIVAVLDAPFREEVSARYAAYMGRVGTPDFPSEQIEEWVDAAAATLFPGRTRAD